MKEKLKMSKFIIFSLTIVFMASSAVSAQERLSQHKKIEVYEIKPGILLMPIYTATNEVCEFGIERLQYTSARINLNLNVSREELLQILDEQVPINERGALRPKDSFDIYETRGQTVHMTTWMEYENVSIRIYSVPFPLGNKGGSEMKPIVATAKWKHRVCR